MEYARREDVVLYYSDTHCSRCDSHIRWFMIGLILVLAGAIGNFIDRIRLGYVVDMFQTDFMSFPIFNVADVTLVCGVICILIYIILDEKDQRKK